MGNSHSKNKHPRSNRQDRHHGRPRNSRPPSYESRGYVCQTSDQHEMNEAHGNSATQNDAPSNSKPSQHEVDNSIHPVADEQVANSLEAATYRSESHNSHGFHKSHRHPQRHHRQRKQHGDHHQSRRHHRTYASSPSGSRRGHPDNTTNSYHSHSHLHSHIHIHSHPPQSQPHSRRLHDNQCSRPRDRSRTRNKRGSKASSHQHSNSEANRENLFLTKNHHHGTQGSISSDVAIEYIPPGRRAKQLLTLSTVPASPGSDRGSQKHDSHDRTASPGQSRGRTRIRSLTPNKAPLISPD
ncbi:hypothetical protein GGR58DRAFT_501487 [Xylaria digitata]|nr:hypothetical protein GGR58DRAFT_501487 [Xylaria digitata]